tara:strand:+ start:57 stop:1235 length:1179 start_codon:yes stop_codon:yes gene_type:complete
MAETETKIEALEKEVTEASANPQADAPKKNAVAAEPTHLSNEAEDLGSAVVKPTDSNPDATKKVKPVSGDAQQKNAGAADAMPKLKEEQDETVEEGSEEIKEASKDEKEDEKSEMMSMDKKKKDMPKDEMMMKKASYKKEETEAEDEKIDVTADVDALVKDEDLSEEFKSKAATIFEAAVNSKVKEAKKKMHAGYEEKLKEESEKAKGELVEKVDSYLAYVVEEWMKENELALERGIKGEIAEDFISGLKKLFEEHYISVPDEKYDVLEDQASKIESLEKKLNEEIEKNVELNKENSESKRASIVAEMGEDLAETSKEKFNKLAEEVEYKNEEDFRAKVSTIKESYFGAKKEASSDIDDVAVGESTENVDLSKSMAAYTAAITKTKDIKLSK